MATAAPPPRKLSPAEEVALQQAGQYAGSATPVTPANAQDIGLDPERGFVAKGTPTDQPQILAPPEVLESRTDPSSGMLLGPSTLQPGDTQEKPSPVAPISNWIDAALGQPGRLESTMKKLQPDGGQPEQNGQSKPGEIKIPGSTEIKEGAATGSTSSSGEFKIPGSTEIKEQSTASTSSQNGQKPAPGQIQIAGSTEIPDAKPSFTPPEAAQQQPNISPPPPPNLPTPPNISPPPPLNIPTPTPESSAPDPHELQQVLKAQGISPGAAQAVAAGQIPKTISGDTPPPKPPPTPLPTPSAADQAIRAQNEQALAHPPQPTQTQQPEQSSAPQPDTSGADHTGVPDFFHKRGDQPITSENDPRLTTVNSGQGNWQVNKEAAPYFQGFLDELKAQGAPITSEQHGGWNYRNIAGTNKLSEHAFGGAIDLNQTGRNTVTPEFQKWIDAHPGALQQAEKHWHIYGGERFGDLGHFEWGGIPGDESKQIVGGGMLKGTATTFGLNYDGSIDQDDNGKGIFGANTRNPKLKGVAVPVDVLEATFGHAFEPDGKGGYSMVNTPEAKKVIAAIQSAHVEALGLDGKIHSFPIVDIQGSLGRHPGKVLDLTPAAGRELGFNDNHSVNYQIVGGDGKPYSIPADQLAGWNSHSGGTAQESDPGGLHPETPAPSPEISLPTEGGHSQPLGFQGGGGYSGGGGGGGGGGQRGDSSDAGGVSFYPSGGGGGDQPQPQPSRQSMQVSAPLPDDQQNPMVQALINRGFTPQQAQQYAQGVQNIAPGKGIGPLNQPPPAPSAAAQLPGQIQQLRLSLSGKQPVTPQILSAKQLMPSFKVTKAPPAPGPQAKTPLRLNAPPPAPSAPSAPAQQAQAPKQAPPQQPAKTPVVSVTPQQQAPARQPTQAQAPARPAPPPKDQPTEFTGRPAGSTHGNPNPPGIEELSGSLKDQGAQHAGLLSGDDPRVKKQKDGYIKGEHFVEGDPYHENLLNGLPYGKQGRQRGILGQGETAVADKTPMHISYISAPQEAEKFPTRESRKVQYDAHSPEARLMGTTEGQLVGHSMIPLNVGVKLPDKKGEKAGDPHQGYIQGLSTNILANNFQHLNDKLSAMGRKTPYKELGTKFSNDLEGYFHNLLAGHTATGSGYAIGTEHHPNEPDREHVPYMLTRKEADFIGTVINNDAAFAKHEDAQKIRELARANGTLITEKGETNRLQHDIEQHEPGWRKRVLESAVKTFRAGLIHEIHPTEEHMPESIRPGKGYQALTKALARTSERGRPDIAVGASLHHTFQDNAKLNKIERDFSEHRIDEAAARERLKALGEDPEDYRFIGGSGGLITPYEDDPEALTPEEHSQMKDNLRQQWVGGKLGVDDYRKKAAEVPLPSKPSKPAAPKPVATAGPVETPEAPPVPKPIAPKPPKPPKPKAPPSPEPEDTEAPEPEEETPAPKPKPKKATPPAVAPAPDEPLPEKPVKKPAKEEPLPEVPKHIKSGTIPEGDDISPAVKMHGGVHIADTHTTAARSALAAKMGSIKRLDTEPKFASLVDHKLNSYEEDMEPWERGYVDSAGRFMDDKEGLRLAAQKGMLRNTQATSLHSMNLMRPRKDAPETAAPPAPDEPLPPVAKKPKVAPKKVVAPQEEKELTYKEMPAAQKEVYVSGRVKDRLANQIQGAVKLRPVMEGGKYKRDDAGNPQWERDNYDLVNSPLLGKKRLDAMAGKDPKLQFKDQQDIYEKDEHTHLNPTDRRRLSHLEQKSAVDTMADKIVEHYQKHMVNEPSVMAAKGWYTTMQQKLKNAFGPDAEIFAQLLGATSARTGVHQNFIQSLDAFDQLKNGNYKNHIEKYLEAHDHLAKGEGSLAKHMRDSGILDQMRANGTLRVDKKTGQMVEPKTDAAAMADWIEHHNILPRQKNGQKFNANSNQVLKVLAQKWLQSVKAPKTPNFAGNLSGRTREATIDVWAARFLHELGNEGNKKPWMLQPGGESGVRGLDFSYAQRAFRKAADKLGIEPDDLQAIAWYYQKHLWDQRGHTKGQGAKKASFDETFDKIFRPSGERMSDEEARQAFAGEKDEPEEDEEEAA